jgi:threonine/homoserine/homoserine lactone efflux protein
VSGIHDYWLFVAAGVLLNLTPGQDTLFIIGRALSGGSRAGVAAACGICVGSVGHTLAAALGLSLLLASSALAFTLVKLLGAAYLIYLGTKLLLSKAARYTAASALVTAAAGGRSAFLQGMLTNLLNPKVALFFLAFLPQFIDPRSGARTLAFLALGATFVTTGLIWCLILALAAGRLQAFFLANPNARALIDRAVGALFVALGARLAWSR